MIKFSIEKPRLSGITKHGLNTTYIYIITLQTISFGPTKVDLNKYTWHFPGANIFPFDSSNQMVRADCRVQGVQGDKMADDQLSLPQDKCCFNAFSSIDLTLAALLTAL